MKTYDVKISGLAKIKMKEIYDYIEESLHSKQNAINQYTRIANAILSLSYMPERMKLVDFEPERSQGVRRMLIDNYSIFFIIDKSKSQVHVSNVIFSKSDIETKLKEKE